MGKPGPESKRIAGTAFYVGRACVKCGEHRRHISSRSCVDCEKTRQRVRYHASPEGKARIRDQQLRKKYGITLRDAHAMLVAQGGRCVICQLDLSGCTNWHMDHDHTTGTIRSILCRTCNPGLGHFKDKPATLIAAAAYLTSHGAPFIPTPIADWLKANPL